MKKLAIAACLFLLVTAGKGQTIVGLKLGANISHLKTTAGGFSVVLDSKVGINGGLFITIPSGKNFSIQPEIVYSMEGTKLKQINEEITLHYVNLPLMFQYNASGLIVEAGPQVGILVAAKQNSMTATNWYKTFNAALGLGAAYRFKVGVGVNARYNWGLTNIYKTSGQDNKLFGNVIQLGLTFALSSVKRR